MAYNGADEVVSLQLPLLTRKTAPSLLKWRRDYVRRYRWQDGSKTYVGGALEEEGMQLACGLELHQHAEHASGQKVIETLPQWTDVTVCREVLHYLELGDGSLRFGLPVSGKGVGNAGETVDHLFRRHVVLAAVVREPAQHCKQYVAMRFDYPYQYFKLLPLQ